MISCHRISSISTEMLLSTINKCVKENLWKITYLDLSDNEISDEQLKYLTDCLNESAISNISTLYIHSNVLSGISIKPLCKKIASGELPKLTEFSLFDNPISDEDFNSIKKHFKKDNHSNIPYTKLVEESAKFAHMRTWCKKGLKSPSSLDLPGYSTPKV